MLEHSPSFDELDHGHAKEHAQLRGKPLASRRRFLIKRVSIVLAYLLILAVAIVGTFVVEKLIFMGIGFALLAITAAIALEVLGEGLFELKRAFDYKGYRENWEQANLPATDRKSRGQE